MPLKESNVKLIEYSVLVFGIFLFFLVLMVFHTNTNLIIIMCGLAAVGYSVWGVVHHALEYRLTMEVALEYILISFFVFLLVLTALTV